jgi:hypothetical protein
MEQNETKTVGIVTDSYKADRIVQELKNAGYEITRQITIRGGIESIGVKINSDEIRKLAAELTRIGTLIKKERKEKDGKQD